MAILDEIPPPETFKDFGERGAFNAWMKYAVIVAALVCVAGIVVCLVVDSSRKGKPKPVAEEPAKTEDAAEAKPGDAPPPDLHNPVRPAPKSFPMDSNLPRGPERFASGPIDLATFKPATDLTRFEDKRVWFDSDNKTNAAVDDHIIHRAMDVPLKRLTNLLEKKGGKLKVHDAYRAADKNKIHLENSLHCEGRAVDLTCEGISLSELAKLAWSAGFDFVLYEKPGKSGEHLHCSVKRSPDAPLPERPVAETASTNAAIKTNTRTNASTNAVTGTNAHTRASASTNASVNATANVSTNANVKKKQ